MVRGDGKAGRARFVGDGAVRGAGAGVRFMRKRGGRRGADDRDGLGGVDHFWSYFDVGNIGSAKLSASVERYAAGVLPLLRERYGTG